MCELFDDIREEGSVDGRVEGRLELIKAKYIKGKSMETIADELECELEEIRDLYKAVKACGLDSTIEEIFEFF